MKRFLAMFAIMAMIVSMFSGVAFAAYTTEDTVELEVTDDTLYYGENVLRYLRGKVLNDDGAKISGDIDLGIRLKGTTTVLDEFTVADGEFTRKLIVGDGNFEVANYELTVTSPAALTTTTAAAFVIVNEVELETPTDLDINFSDVEDQMIVQGVFVNGDGTTSTGAITLGYQDGSAKVTANYATEDAFGFLFDAESTFTKTGKIGLYINDVLAIEGEIVADDLDVTMSPTSLVRALTGVGQDVELSFGSALKDGQSVKVTIEDESSTETFAYDATEFNDDNDVLTLDFEDEFTISGYDEDDYTLVVELHNGTTTIKKAELDFEVEDPEDYNLVNWTADKVAIGSYVFGIGETTAGADFQIHVMDDESATIDLTDEDIEYEITYSGAGIDETVYNTADETEDEDTLTVKPTETGMIEMEIVVKDDGTTVATFDKEIEVTGWNLTVSPTEVVVGVENDIAVEIVDEDGIAINNAVVQIVSEGGTVIDTVNSETTNISNGLYLFEDLDFEDVGKYDVEAYTQTEYDADGDYEVSLEEEIEVVGEEVYTVDTNKAQLLTGIEEKVLITALDENGDVIYPTFYQIDYDKDGKELSSAVVSGTRKDVDEDGVKEAVELTLTPNNKAVETVIRATTDDDTKMGEVSIEVLKPELVHTGAAVITENFKTELEFTVVDPRDDSVMELDLAAFDADSVSYTTVNPVEEALDDDSDDVWTATVLVQEVDWKEATDEEDTVELTVLTDEGLKVGTIEVVKPTLTSDPEKVIVSSSANLTLTYLDGEGNPLEDYKVYLDGEEIGTTNVDGQVMYAASAMNTLSLEFTAATDAKYTVADADEDIEVDDPIYTELIVKSGADTEKPVITAEVQGSTAVISIVDDSRIDRVAINGQILDKFYLGSNVTELVTLASGVNTFNVQAVDVNGNYAQTILELEAEVVEPELEFTIGEASEYGTPVMMEGTTMVPVRFAESLGATVTWDAPTATVTYTVGDDVIELTEGSTTAVVNGANVQLRVAPYMNTELYRLMVPLRMISEELGFTVTFTSVDAPITVTK